MKSFGKLAACLVRLSMHVVLSVLVTVSTSALPTLSQTPGAQRETREQILARGKRNYRIFYGLDDPIYDTPQQIERLHRMCVQLKQTILDELECGNLDLTDPTAGIGGSAQHLAGALNVGADLGTLLRDRGCPFELEGNYYAKATAASEEKLRQMILQTAGNLTPGDLMKMSLRANSNNYVMATLTLHNFLKNIAYTGRKTAEGSGEPITDYAQETVLPANYENLHIVEVTSKLQNLRGDPTKGDKLGPWYHMFGIQMLGALAGKDTAGLMTTAEQFSRLLINEWLGIKSYSPIDPEKAAWDECAIRLMKDLHPIMYGKEVPQTKRSIRVLSSDVTPPAGIPGTEFTVKVEYAVSGMTSDFKVPVKESGRLNGPNRSVFPVTERVMSMPPTRVIKEWKCKPTLPGQYVFNYSLDEKCSCRQGSIPFEVLADKQGSWRLTDAYVEYYIVADQRYVRLGPVGDVYKPIPGIEVGGEYFTCSGLVPEIKGRTITIQWTKPPSTLSSTPVPLKIAVVREDEASHAINVSPTTGYLLSPEIDAQGRTGSSLTVGYIPNFQMGTIYQNSIRQRGVRSRTLTISEPNPLAGNITPKQDICIKFTWRMPRPGQPGGPNPYQSILVHYIYERTGPAPEVPGSTNYGPLGSPSTKIRPNAQYQDLAPAVTSPSSMPPAGSAATEMQPAAEQIFTVNKTRLIQSFPKAALYAQTIKKAEAYLQKHIDAANADIARARASGRYSQSSINRMVSETQAEIDRITADIKARAANFEQELARDIETAMQAEAQARRVPRSQIRYAEDYGGSGIDITSGIIGRLPADTAPAPSTRQTPTSGSHQSVPSDDF